MSRRPVRRLLVDIQERVDRIRRYTDGLDRTGFLVDDKTVDSVIRSLEIIGEAANRLPESFRQRHPEIPWRRIVGLRNRVIHGYFDVDLELVWAIVQRELPNLHEAIGRLLEQDDPEFLEEPG